MKTIPELPAELLGLIRHGEDYQLEYKEARTDLPKNLFDTVCSFSNREGGDIFLGVHDCGVILGVDPNSAAKLITNFGNQANNKDKLFPPTYLAAKEYVYHSEGGFAGRDKNGKVVTEASGEYHVLHIKVPISPVVVRHRNRIFDRNGDADVDITDIPDMVFQCYARKHSTYYVNKVYPFWSISDLRSDLIDRAREMAAARRRRDGGSGRHPWEGMDNEELLRTSGLILTDEQGRTGLTLAAVLLFGNDNMIASACAHHKTDCIYRVYNLDRYDDRDVIDPTNLLDSYDRMFDFGQKHLNDLFVLDGIQSVSARDAILREIISNSLAHRDYANGYVAKMVIERDQIRMENGNRAHGIGALDIKTFKPFPKNPPISKVFREIGLADELGSGMRNSYKYTRLYSGGEPEFIEGDVFEILIPLTTGAMTKVGPVAPPMLGGEASTQASTHASTHAGTQAIKNAGKQASTQASTHAGTHADTHAGRQGENAGSAKPVTIKLDANLLADLLQYCSEPRTRAEIQEFCGIKTREYFRKSVLAPMVQAGQLLMTIPDKPRSPYQKYYWNKRG